MNLWHDRSTKRPHFTGYQFSPKTRRGRSNDLRQAIQSRLLTVVLAGVSIGCTWSRFDEVTKASPIQILEPPKNLRGVGTSLAAARGKSATLAFAKGDQGYLLYGFGATDLVSSDAIDQGSCRAREGCWMGAQVAAIGQDLTSATTACFAFGVTTGANDLAHPVLYCEGHETRGLGVPEPPPMELLSLSANANSPVIFFASGPRLAPDLLVAAMPNSGAAWLYSPSTGAPVAIAKPAVAGETFGTGLAVAGAGAARFVAIAEPASGNLHLFRTDGELAPDATLCISSSVGFATALAAGHFVAAGSEDLAIAGVEGLLVLPALETLPFTADSSAGCLPLSDVVAAPTLSCEALLSGSAGCPLLGSATIAASDLDGDGQDELLVGLPDAASRGNVGAGKLLYASLGGPAPRVIGELSPSSAESGDRFGTSIVGVPLSRPEVVLAGAPGGNKLAALFCTSLLGPSNAYARCD